MKERALLILVALLAAVGAGGLHADERETKAREEWMAGYVKLEEGGRAEEAGADRQALTLYREALRAFQEVRRKYPSWNPSLLGYRINFCIQRIRRLESQVDRATGDMSQEELAEVASRQVSDIRRLNAENRQLKEKLALTAEALERARRESARTVSSAEDIKALVTECADLKNKNAVQQQQIEQLSAEVTALRRKEGLEQAAEKLRQDLERTRAREAQLEKAFETYRKAYENVKERLKQATIDREKLIRISRELKDRADQATESVQAVADERNQIKQKLEALEEARRHDADALARRDGQLQQMRDEMTRLKRELASLRTLREQRADQAADHQNLVSQVQQLMREKNAADQQAADLRTRVEQAEQRAAELETRIERQQEARRAEIARLTEARKTDAQEPGPAETSRRGPDRASDPSAVERKPQTTTADLLAERERGQEAARKVRILEQELGRVRQRLAEADQKVTQQEELIRTQGRKLADVKAIADMLEVKEKTLEQQNRELAEARENAAQRKTALASTRQREKDLQAELAAAQGRLQQLGKHNLRIAAALQRLEHRQEDAQRLRSISSEQLQQNRELLAAVEAERDALRQKNDEQLTLLKQQEKELRRLEEHVRKTDSRTADMEKELAVLRGQIRQQQDAFESRVETMKAKTEVVDGLTASLADADAELEESRRQLAVNRQEKMTLETRFAETRRELEKAREQLGRYQEAIATGVSVRDKTLMDQIGELTSRLERETEKRRALEKAIAASPVQMTPERPESRPRLDLSPRSEQERREREQRALVRGYLRQAVAAEESGKTEAARWNYRKVLELDDSLKLPVQRLGLIAAAHGDDDEAVRYLRRAFKIDPDDLDTIIPLGFALMRDQQPDLALSMLSRAVALEPDNPVAHRCLGIACSSLGWYDAAEVQFRRTRRIDDRDGEAAFNLAVLLSTREPPRLDEARSWYAKALAQGVARDPGLDELFGVEAGGEDTSDLTPTP